MKQSSYERMRRAVQHREPDVVPVAPYMGNHGACIAGVPIDKYCQSGRLMAEAQYRAWEEYGQDALVPQSDAYYLAEGFGLKVQHHPDSIPTVIETAVEDIHDIYKLKVPDPKTDGRMSVYLEAIERLLSKVGKEVTIRATGTGPFSLAGHLMGTENFIMRLAVLKVEPDEETEHALKHLMELTTEALTAFARACIDAGADIVQAGDSLASLNMISPDMYSKWAFPYEAAFFDKIAPVAKENNCATLLHICGDNTAILNSMANTGADIIELDSAVDMKTAKQNIGDKVCLMGNIDPSSVLLQGSVNDVEEKARKVIEDAGAGSGLILGSGCEVPPNTPKENMKALIRIARNSRYPL